MFEDQVNALDADLKAIIKPEEDARQEILKQKETTIKKLTVNASNVTFNGLASIPKSIPWEIFIQSIALWITVRVFKPKKGVKIKPLKKCSNSKKNWRTLER